MNKDKSIKDLKQYNDKIKTQLEYSKVRVWNLEKQNERLQQELQRKDNILSELKELIIKDINFPELVDKEKIENIIKELEENK